MHKIYSFCLQILYWNKSLALELFSLNFTAISWSKFHQGSFQLLQLVTTRQLHLGGKNLEIKSYKSTYTFFDKNFSNQEKSLLCWKCFVVTQSYVIYVHTGRTYLCIYYTLAQHLKMRSVLQLYILAYASGFFQSNSLKCPFKA